ncbi:trypsin-like serine protease, partial [Myxococcota bacterium]|nr:trypsin-like serine protease [Myxococcota bacterium]
EYGSSWSNICSATLVSDYHVLTAAHCVLSMYGGLMDPSEIRFAIGQDALLPDDVFNVVAIHTNPLYDMWGSTTGYDHAVLELARSPLASLDVEPIPVNYQLFNGLEGNYVQQVGYGTTEDNYDNSDRWWTLELVDSFKVNIGEMTVDGQGESSVCDGDSGGPSLYAVGGSGLSILGTVSWGDASCVDFDHYAMTNWDSEFLTTWIPEYDYCGDLSQEGTCDGTQMARWCEGGIIHRECCDEITGPCTVVNGIAQCQEARDPCPQGLDFRGTCNGQVATWCFDGQVHTRDCTNCGQQCVQTSSVVIGSYCVSPDL